MRVFLDFEASSLAKHGYPIEVAWVFEDGASETHLIRPAPDWTDWDAAAEALHGISRSRLETEGEPHDTVARRLLEALSQHTVYASAPSWDGKWLSLLLRSAGLPRHSLRLKDTDEVQAETAAELLRPTVREEELPSAVAAVLKQAREAAERVPVRHRALQDAEQERRLWLEVGRLAHEAAQRLAAAAGMG